MSSTATAAPARSGRTGRSDQSARPGRTLSRRFWDRWADPLYTLFVVLLLQICRIFHFSGYFFPSFPLLFHFLLLCLDFGFFY